MNRSILAASLLALLPTTAFAQKSNLRAELPAPNLVELGKVVTQGNQRFYYVKFDQTNIMAVEHLYRQLQFVLCQKNKRVDMLRSDLSGVAGNTLVINKLSPSTAPTSQPWDAEGKMTFLFGLKEKNGFKIEQNKGFGKHFDKVDTSTIERSVFISFHYYANSRELIVTLRHADKTNYDKDINMFPFSETGLYTITGKQVAKTLSINSRIEGSLFQTRPEDQAANTKLDIGAQSNIVQSKNVLSVRLSDLSYTVSYGDFGIWAKPGAASAGSLVFICAAQWGTSVNVSMNQEVGKSTTISCGTQQAISAKVSWSDIFRGISGDYSTATVCTKQANTVPMSVSFFAKHEGGTGLNNAMSSVFNLHVEFDTKNSKSFYQLKYGSRLHYAFRAEAHDRSDSLIDVRSKGTGDGLLTQRFNEHTIKN